MDFLGRKKNDQFIYYATYSILMTVNGSMKRVVLYVPVGEYAQLRAMLIVAGLSVSEWFRRIVRKYLAKQSG